MPFLIRLLAPLLFLCACLLGFMSIGGMGQVDTKVAQVTVAVCIALSVLAGVMFRYSFMRASSPVGVEGKWPAVLGVVSSRSTKSASAPMTDKDAAPAQAQ